MDRLEAQNRLEHWPTRAQHFPIVAQSSISRKAAVRDLQESRLMCLRSLSRSSAWQKVDNSTELVLMSSVCRAGKPPGVAEMNERTFFSGARNRKAYMFFPTGEVDRLTKGRSVKKTMGWAKDIWSPGRRRSCTIDNVRREDSGQDARALRLESKYAPLWNW